MLTLALALTGCDSRHGKGLSAADRFRFMEQCDGRDANACSEMSRYHGMRKNTEFMVEYAQKGCKLKDRLACITVRLYGGTLASDFIEGKGRAPDQFKAFHFYELACKAGDHSSCAHMGDQLLEGRGVRQNTARGLKALRTSCEHGAGVGCFRLGVVHLTGKFVPQDNMKGVTLYQRACELGYGHGCVALAGFYETGHVGLGTDLAKARELFGRGCDLKSEQGCQEFAKLNLAEIQSN